MPFIVPTKDALRAEEDGLRGECRALGMPDSVAEYLIAAMRIQWAAYSDALRLMEQFNPNTMTPEQIERWATRNTP